MMNKMSALIKVFTGLLFIRMSKSFIQGPSVLKKSQVLKTVSTLFSLMILIIAAFPAPAHATAVPIYVELNQFTSANVDGDGGTSLLWKKANANTTTSGVLRIVPNTGNQRGVVVRRNKVKLNGGFSTYFVMNMNSSTSSSPADGLTFVIQSNSEPEVGNWGAGLGYQSVEKSLGVEFDIWKNTGWDIATSTGQYYYDPNANHVAIVENGNNMHAPANNDAIDDGTLTTGTLVTTGAGTALTPQKPGTLSLYRKDGTLDVNVWIDYDGSTLTATYGPDTTKNSINNRVISKYVGNFLNNQDVYVGFSGSTGAANANIDIKKWCFTDTYDPDPVVPPTQGANSVEITLIPGSINPTTAKFRVKDINNIDMLNQDVDIYLDDSTTPTSTINTGADGARANYSIGTLSAGSHTIKGVATNGGASNSASFNVIVPITAIGAINGTAQVGSILTAGALTPVGATASYQWQIASTVNGSYSNITGATETTYTPVAEDLAKFIKVVATGIGSYSGTVTSAPTQAVAAPPALYVSPVAATIPFGSAQQFEALFTNGTPDAFDYAIFSGSSSDLLGVYGSNLTINGDIHTNNAFQSSSSIFNMTGTCEAVKTVNVWGSIIHMKTPVENAAYIDMPDFSEIIKTQANAAGQSYVGNKNYSGTNINLSSPIYVNGDLTISGSRVSGKGTIVATGDITISGSGISLANGASVCIYSKTGNITVSSSVATLNGIFYAPKGRIGVYASNETINGRLVGNTVQLSCSTLNITSSANDLSSLPLSGPISVTPVWSSSNPNVATINSAGVATGNGLGTCTITATYNATYQASAQLTVVSLTAINPTTATFDKNSANTSAGHYADVATTMTLSGTTLSSIKNGNTTLSTTSGYTVSGSTVRIKKEYLGTQSVGITNLTFTFSDGSTRTLAVTVSDSTPPTISPTTATFDKNSANTSAGHYGDVTTSMTLYSASLISIKNGGVPLTVGNDYTVSGNTVTIKKEYLGAQSVGITNLTFTFSDGSTKSLEVTVSDSTLTKLISDLSISTQNGSHRITILPNVPIQAIVTLKLSRPATYLKMDFSKSNLNVALSNGYCDYINSGVHTQINYTVDDTDLKTLVLHPIDSNGQNTTFPGGANTTYTFNALITEDGTSLIMEATVTAQDANDLTFIDSTDAQSDLSLNITVGTAPPLH
ncbi:X2-like carbohydrate binding domain-containing protein [Desulfosporosinus sp. OT]|uniref:X2-like carbohydrate binding domain-containing protein n=1 Tax=Desulfosporosinus sp. OT TaxID=913865 RepID=UPI001FA7234F|nr:X2-like carbohydrate binding domain-containing protein [Desulfosporosinus sp. OT]